MFKTILLIAFFICQGAFSLQAKVFNQKLLQNFIELQPTAKKWQKQVWSEIALDQKVNSALFLPYNSDIPAYDHSIDDIDPKLYDTKKSSIQWNLYTIITSQFIKGNLKLNSPFNPEWEAEKDHGFLQFPITAEIYGTSKEGNFQTDIEFRNYVKTIFLGSEIIDPYAYPLKSYIYPDEDSLVKDESGFMAAVYPPSDYLWFTDDLITKYKIKETWVMDKNGNVKDKIIDAIAPVINSTNGNGEIIGERTLFWVDFNDLNEKLKGYFTVMTRYKKEEIISLSAFFERRAFYADSLPEIKSTIKKAEEH